MDYYLKYGDFMKNGFILTGDYSIYMEEFSLIEQMFAKLNLDVKMVDFNDISVLAEDDFKGKIYINNERVDCPDFIIVATVDERGIYKLRSVVRMFETLGVKCINTVDAIEKSGDKIYSFQLAKSIAPEVKIPKTILISPDVSLDTIEEEIGFPLVMKIMDGNQGSGVCLIDSKEELEDILNILTASEFGQEILVQEAILSSKGKDIRVVVAGGEVIHSFVRSNDSDFKSNLHQGGSFERFTPPQSLIDSSIKLAKGFGLELGSIDYLFGDTDDEFYLCELNSIPGISYVFEARKNGDIELIKKFTDGIIRITQ